MQCDQLQFFAEKNYQHTDDRPTSHQLMSQRKKYPRVLKVDVEMPKNYLVHDTYIYCLSDKMQQI